MLMFRVLASTSTPTTGVSAVLDVDDGDQVPGVVDAVEHTKGAAARRVQTGELAMQWLADPAGIRGQRAGDELDDGCCHSFGQPRLDARAAPGAIWTLYGSLTDAEAAPAPRRLRG